MSRKVSDLNLQDKKEDERIQSEIRLQLYLARCGVASRRASEIIITEGRVTVNGQKVDKLGSKVSLDDVVCVDGKEVKIEEIKRYVLLFKPTGVVCSLADEKDRQVAADLLKSKYSERLYNVGRLDMFSQGLILFTNDGEFARKLSHPSSQIEKEYIVDTSLPIPLSVPESFKKGIRIDDVFYKCLDAELLNTHRMRVVLVEGKNREIRRIFEYFQIGIKSLTRVRIGSLGIDGLQSGEFRDLTVNEIRSLYDNCN